MNYFSNYTPPMAGRVLYGGGWSVSYDLGKIAASPEFHFPLQLVYASTHSGVGLFGPQWHCPQLESQLLPRGQGELLWTMPSGRPVLLQADKKRPREFTDYYGFWRAKVSSASQQTIFSPDGWAFEYFRGQLNAVTSPTGRELRFSRLGGRLRHIELRDPLTSKRVLVAQFAFLEGNRLTDLQLGAVKQRFAYDRGQGSKLVGWQLPTRRQIRFDYSKEGVLARVFPEVGKEMTFVSEYVRPPRKNAAAQGPNPERNPANYWLKEDTYFTYEYGGTSKAPNPLEITATVKTSGLRQALTGAPKRGMVTREHKLVETTKPSPKSKEKSQETTVFGDGTVTYYYIAPGQKYHGKVRRVERDGQLVAEHRYDQKTGLLLESWDVKGMITFYDYNPFFKPQNREHWEPKPIRIRKGSRKSSEVVAEYAYDDLGRLSASKDAEGNVTRFIYNGRNEVVEIIEPSGVKTRFAYDEFGRRTAIGRDEQIQRINYDGLGRIISRIEPDGSRTEFAYDALGQVIETKRNGQPVKQLVRNGDGRVIAERDPYGREKKLEYDAHGNVTAEIAPNGATTRYEYDSLNRRVAQIDGNGNKIRFEYDAMHRLIRQTNPLGGTLTWKRDEKGRLVEKTNGEQVIRYTYTKSGKLESLDYGHNQRIDYAYDRRDRLVRAVTPTRSTTYYYDSAGRVEAMEYTDATRTQVVNYRYNARGQKTAVILSELVPGSAPRGDIAGKEDSYRFLHQTEYDYDPAGRLIAIKANGEPVVTYTHDAAGRMASRNYANGIQSTIQYDAMGRLARIEFQGGIVRNPIVLAYEWNAANEVVRRHWNGETHSYDYDPSGQLLRVWREPTAREGRPDTSGERELLESYTYDAAGNILEQMVYGEKTQMAYDAANQLKSTETTPRHSREPIMKEFSYDKAGRMRTLSNGGQGAYGWLDKLVALSMPDQSVATFDYHPDGHLAFKKVADPAGEKTEEQLLWDGLALLRKNDQIFIIEPHANGGTPIASDSIGFLQPAFYLNDMLGTTLARVKERSFEPVPLSTFGRPIKYEQTLPSPQAMEFSANQ